VFLEFGRKALYKYGAADERYGQTRANTLVMWEAIRRYNSAGYESLCFGKTEKHHSGLLQFKMGWGARQFEVNGYHYDLRRRAFLRGGPRELGCFSAIFRRLPLPILRMIGFLGYRFMG
jgi:lipid II:glycine glycyltransferase (peptidoglycan interpeptide bridge formation enzyme)